ncbi:hypothetical protein GOP47_0002713 [Adiantum capillus-veneris]|uniref:Uncharacterized protein n=1 Tax=Adiantum capillus-veneris TaxID=13818 RepID=A0A9D4VBG2_ADICA|nr:hypothetical protein GOP47_0002713 [Adiantum capillus-veneris]
MRKVLWSPDEDERLVRCITTYVHGSWSDIARNAGLKRCGKSCRRRWLNHLRPDLKRGKFSSDEINLIVQLHEAMGNRWSDIARHLKGRTDNDVKNLWNTQIKKRMTLTQQSETPSSSHVLLSMVSESNESTGSTNATKSQANHQDPIQVIHIDMLTGDGKCIKSCNVEKEGNGDISLTTGSGNNMSISLDECSYSTSSSEDYAIASEPCLIKDSNISLSARKPSNVSLQPQQNHMPLIWGNNYVSGNNSEYLLMNGPTVDQDGAAVAVELTRTCSSSSSNSQLLAEMPTAVQPSMLSTPERPTFLDKYQENYLNLAAYTEISPTTLQSTGIISRHSSIANFSTLHGDRRQTAENVTLPVAQYINNEHGWGTRLSTNSALCLAHPELIGQSSSTSSEQSCINPAPHGQSSRTLIQQSSIVNYIDDCIQNSMTGCSAYTYSPLLVRSQFNSNIDSTVQASQHAAVTNTSLDVVSRATHTADQDHREVLFPRENGSNGEPLASVGPLPDADHIYSQAQMANCLEEWESMLTFPDLWKLLLLLN